MIVGNCLLNRARGESDIAFRAVTGALPKIFSAGRSQPLHGRPADAGSTLSTAGRPLARSIGVNGYHTEAVLPEGIRFCRGARPLSRVGRRSGGRTRTRQDFSFILAHKCLNLETPDRVGFFQDENYTSLHENERNR